jgi:predicted ArsR family transcriptional regulator
MSERSPDPIAALAVLGEPVRRRLYDAVAAAAAGPLDRDMAAEAAGVSRGLAAFHLDRLVDAGLLAAEFRRRTGRSGPGAGRPAKFYRRADAPVDVSLPPRRPARAAAFFAAGVERTADGRRAVLQAAHEAGAQLALEAVAGGEPRDAVLELLAGEGFEPRPAADGGVALGNCPFRDLTTDHRDLTCSANLAFLGGVTESVPAAGLTAIRVDPPVPCCVMLQREPERAREPDGEREREAGASG